MATTLATTTQQDKRYTLDALRDEATALVHQHKVNRQQPIYTLCHLLPTGEWVCFEKVLKENEFLMRDPIIDLLSQESWEEDA